MKRFLPRMSKKVLASLAVFVATLGVAGAVSAWYPERPTYTIENPAPHVTFNSITNNPNYGDERTFFDVKDAANTNSGGFVDKATVQDGQELLLRVYVHNNASRDLNGQNYTGSGVAKNTKVRIHLPTATEEALRANAYISADNAKPQVVSDTIDMVGQSGNKFEVEYVPGSAVQYTNAVPSGMKLSDSIVTSGAPIGYNQLNGVVPGCFEYTSIVTIKVKVKSPSIKVDKTVRKAGEKNWNESMTVKKGDTVEYQIRVQNTGSTNLDNVLVGDNLPPYVSYVQDSTKLMNSNFPNGTNVPSNNITTGGLDIGTAGPGGVSYILFQAKVADEFAEGCGILTLKNVAVAGSNQTGNVEDHATIKVDSEKPCDKPTPKYSCDAVSIEQLGGRKINVGVTASASNGASIKNYVYNFGDNSENLVTDNTSAMHTYAEDGEYIVRVAVNVDVNGEDKLVESDQCAAVVKFEDEKPVTPENLETPVTPATTLPNTGVGSVAGIFAAVSAAGAIAHRAVTARRNS